jgi:probable H4MPT-linked C1 transfer pathway protein
MPHTVLGLDIGGANLKAAHSGGMALLRPFELWRFPGELPDALRRLLSSFPAFDCLAVTMTGELCDCFATRREGVAAILAAVQAVAGTKPVHVWQTAGRFADPAQAQETWLQTAASNWHALATFAGRFAPAGPALLIDIGSTTTDIIPLADGVPIARGRTDAERLQSCELVYTGVRRTPVCAILGSEVAAEFFATTLDVYLVLGRMAENAEDRRTADGRPATVAAAHARLARMLCADAETCSEAQARNLARQAHDRQRSLVGTAICTLAGRLPGLLRTVIVAGSGEFLAREAVAGTPALADLPIVSLADRLGAAISEAACAHAVAVLAAERCG